MRVLLIDHAGHTASTRRHERLQIMQIRDVPALPGRSRSWSEDR